MMRRLSNGKNNHLTCYSLAINPLFTTKYSKAMVLICPHRVCHCEAFFCFSLWDFFHILFSVCRLIVFDASCLVLCSLFGKEIVSYFALRWTVANRSKLCRRVFVMSKSRLNTKMCPG